MAARPTFSAPAKDANELEKRKQLAGAVKELAAGSDGPYDAKGLMAEAEKIGVTRNQLSNLYQRYKAEGPAKSSPLAPTTAAPTTAAPTTAAPTTAAPTTAAPTTAAPTTAAPLSPAEKVKAAFQPHSVATPKLDQLNAMQSAPLGAYSDIRRQATGFRGRPLGSGGQKGEMADIARRIMTKAVAERERSNAEEVAAQQAFIDRNKPIEDEETDIMPYVRKKAL